MSHPILEGVRYSVHVTYPDGCVENRRGFPSRDAAQRHIDKYDLVDLAVIMEWYPMFTVTEGEV